MRQLRRLFSDSLRRGWPVYLLVTAVFGLGVLLGSLGASSLPEGQAAELQRHIQTFIARAAEIDVDKAQMARSALYDNLLAGAMIYIFGLTIVCLPLVLAFIFIRGFALGFSVGFLAAEREMQGFFVVMVSMLPHNIFFVPALIIGGTASLSFSLLLLRRFFNSQTRVGPGFLTYTMVMAGVVAVFSLAAITEAYITPELTRFSASLLAGW